MKRLALFALLCLSLGQISCQPQISDVQFEQALSEAFASKQSNLQIQGKGRVIRILPDDLKGSRHQRFIIELQNGQTLLVAHNIDLAPRVDDLKKGDWIEFNGEYEWNSKGGVIHWTHDDPNKSHPDGWLRHKGRVYQ